MRSFSSTIVPLNWISSVPLLSKHLHFYSLSRSHHDLRRSAELHANFISNSFRWLNQIVNSNETSRGKLFQINHFFFNILKNKFHRCRLAITSAISLFLHCIDLYQTAHFFLGFIFEPRGQLKSFENSSMLESGPRTRNLPGLWKPVVMRSFIASGLYLLHQVFAALIQNNCSGL